MNLSDTSHEEDMVSLLSADLESGENLPLKVLLSRFSNIVKENIPIYIPATCLGQTACPITFPNTLPLSEAYNRKEGTHIIDINSIARAKTGHTTLAPPDIDILEPIYLWLCFSYRSENNSNKKSPEARCEFISFLVFDSKGSIINSYYSARFKGVWEKLSGRHVSEITPMKIPSILSRINFGKMTESGLENMRFTHAYCQEGTDNLTYLISELDPNGSGFWFDLESNLGSYFTATNEIKHRIYDLRNPLPPELNSFCPFTDLSLGCTKKRTEPPLRHLPFRKIAKLEHNPSPHQNPLPVSYFDPIHPLLPPIRAQKFIPTSSTDTLDVNSLENWLRENGTSPGILSQINRDDAEKLVEQLLLSDPSFDSSYSRLGYKTKLSLLFGQSHRFGKKTFALSRSYLDQNVWEILSDITKS